MISRTYLVTMPTNSGSMTSLDILVRGPVGVGPADPAGGAFAPVRVAAGGTTPPAGWGTNAGDGQFVEWRSRPISIPVLFAAGVAGGFVPRFQLGWSFAIAAADSAGDGCTISPVALYSASLIGSPASPFAVTGISTPNTDPAYGPVIRLMNSPDVAGRSFVVGLHVAQARDEDRQETGI